MCYLFVFRVSQYLWLLLQLPLGSMSHRRDSPSASPPPRMPRGRRAASSAYKQTDQGKNSQRKLKLRLVETRFFCYMLSEKLLLQECVQRWFSTWQTWRNKSKATKQGLKAPATVQCSVSLDARTMF